MRGWIEVEEVVDRYIPIVSLTLVPTAAILKICNVRNVPPIQAHLTLYGNVTVNVTQSPQEVLDLIARSTE